MNKEKMKILITGVSGFVGHHFLQYLYDNKIEASVCGIDISEPAYNIREYDGFLSVTYRKIDLLDKESLASLFEDFVPDYVLHLASFSSVAYSWKHPEESFVNNTNIFLNLITAIQTHNINCRILSVGSSEEYGIIDQDEIPLSEDKEVRPISPYAVARVAQEMLSKLFVDSYHVNIIMTRSFNHIGPWQDSRFVVPSFIKRIKEIKDAGYKRGIIETGDIGIVRDFVDVRDVVHAYYLLLTKGRVGEIYNVCSGKGIKLEKIVKMIADEIGIYVETKLCEQLVRPNDNPIIVGNNHKITDELGWKPNIPLETTIKNMIDQGE
ncbi:MAG: GDP-mannose 4,6-dehydratase [Lachnospiraceae bacterium]|nr:GDP-mannose 4,6-dehydratase [Lachnospiraceae bacterium]MDD7628502.1 GDP-mannose 4,6-dehydratase [Lachnospiraceae bacterium]MDY4120028.1 GDP-mannose 4,6-dehydratase [Lachnospiraceae bacterium]